MGTASSPFEGSCRWQVARPRRGAHRTLQMANEVRSFSGKLRPSFKGLPLIRYENGKEELYHTAEDLHEWHNLEIDQSMPSVFQSSVHVF